MSPKPRSNSRVGSNDTSVQVRLEKPQVWSYGVNEHLGVIAEAPSTWQPTGVLRTDYLALCTEVAAFPHPGFKPKPKVIRVERRHSSVGHGDAEQNPAPRGRRNSITSASQNPAPEQRKATEEKHVPHHPEQEAHIVVRSMLLDLPSVNLAAHCLLHVQSLRSLTFTDCCLDLEMLRQLRTGLAGQCSVESLLIEWNAFDLPLLSAEEWETVPLPSLARSVQTPALEASSAASVDGDDTGNTDSADSLERRRYLCESVLSICSFRNWLADLARGSWEAAMQKLEADQDQDCRKPLSLIEFQDLLEDKLGAVGPHIAEVFDCLNGPDLDFADSRNTLANLRQAFRAFPEDFDQHFQQTGKALAALLDGDCVIEALSLRSCRVGLPELRPLSAALEQQPWQLRSLNLWENRICDRGAELLALGFESYRGLEYLGLGRNRLTERGLEVICVPFQAVFLDQAGYEAHAERLRALAAKREESEKAAAKAKPKAKAKPNEEQQAGRQRRHASDRVEELEELPVGTQRGTGRGSDRPAWVLRRPSDLQTLNVSENPVRDVKTVEALQPQGQGAELVLRGTPAAAAMLARPAGSRDRRALGARGEGWMLKLTY